MLSRTVMFAVALLALLACNSTQPSAEKSKKVVTDKNQFKRKEFLSYYPTGELQVNGFTQGENRVGTWSAWYKDGSKKSEVYYKNGVKNGEYRLWHPNGQMQVLGFYDMGKATGTWKSFDANGKLLTEKNLNNN